MLILDEALSGVDAKTEGRMLSKLCQLGLTLVIISHGPSTIIAADRIIVLCGGQVACIGRHDELIRNYNVHQELIRRQIIKS